MSRRVGTNLIPIGTFGNRRDTATVLLGTAETHGLGSDSVFASVVGFYVTDELMAVLYSDDVSAINNGVETGPDSESPEPVSGNGQDEDDYYDPSGFSVADIQAEITEAKDVEFAMAVLAAEQDGKNRSTLVKWLDDYIDTNTSEEE